MKTLTCADIAQFIARRADDGESIDAEVRARVDEHLAVCDSCRAALETQRNVSAVLRMRPADRVSPGFAAQLTARLDDASGWFGIADWRAWTLRLAPVAAALALATYLGLGGSTSSSTTVEEWTLGVNDSTTASLLLQSDVSADSVMESMVTGELPAAREGAGNVR
jgi:anti-sigma factor RsiW